MVKGTYKNKLIRAVVEDDVILRFEFIDKPGDWRFPLIEDGRNVERDKFKLEQEEMQLSLDL